MKEREILDAVATASGLDAETIKGAFCGTGVFFEIQSIAMTLMHTEGYAAIDIAVFFGVTRNTVARRINTVSNKLSLQLWSRGYNKSFKDLYLKCAVAVESIAEQPATDTPDNVNADCVFKAIAATLGVSREHLKADNRTHMYAHARLIAFSLLKEYGTKSVTTEQQLTLKDIGAMLDRDHTTVIYGVKTAAHKWAKDTGFRMKYERVLSELNRMEETAV